ncbi:MAG: hypothetical protein ABSG56_15670 [Bryobacteraceae bacterium]
MSLGEPTAHPILLLAPLSGFLIVSSGVNAPVEPVAVERIQAILESNQFGLIAPHSLLAGGMLAHVAGHEFLVQPVQNRAGNHKLMQPLRELAFQNLLARIRLRAFAAAPVLDLAHQGTSAVIAAH